MTLSIIRIGLSVVFLGLTACSQPTLDTTSKVTLQSSLEVMTSNMTREEADKLAHSVAGIYMLSSLQGILNGKTEAEIEENIHLMLHGKNAQEILDIAEKLKQAAKAGS